jgi:hypothetical protein
MPASTLNVSVSGESLPVPESMTAMPPHAHALARLPLRDTCAHGIHKPDQLAEVESVAVTASRCRRTSDMM